ncbi:methyltransferase domain-containing protein [Maribacter sp. CXY002]|uniref:methyltransferase domain-containing protein n=1 Tax=Maribacter luteocoastalis TaxID=3407671 RepID=UPI003B671070
MVDLSVRSDRAELMDDFQGSVVDLQVVLDDITRVNTILGGNDITLTAVFRLIEENIKKSYTILDVGCADGNMLRELALMARKKKIKVKLIGVDLNADALLIARQKSVDFPEIDYFEKDILSDDFSNFKCDIVMNTLMMHHLPHTDILKFTKQFADLASIGVVINDLQRSPLAYYLFRIFSLIFIKTDVAKVDGLISISKGFRKKDLQFYAKELSHLQHQIKWKWAFRYLWVLQKSSRPKI